MEKPVLIFDHDGTLHDSMYIFGPAVHAGERWAEEQGYDIKPVDDEVIKSCLGLNKPDMWGTFGYGLDPDVLEEMIGHVYEEMDRILKAGEARWFNGTQEMLDVLKAQGFHMAILSNCEIKLADFYWNYFKMEKWIDKFYDCESYGFAPKTEIIKQILKDFNGKGIMIGDRDSDLECARAGGVPFIGCAYGFGKPGELDGADAVAYSVRDIPEKVNELMGKIR